jgi:hypothetical protein
MKEAPGGRAVIVGLRPFTTTVRFVARIALMAPCERATCAEGLSPAPGHPDPFRPSGGPPLAQP